ncbi:MAG: hypothetical protein R3F61_30370 [Myxococcota bacterium]
MIRAERGLVGPDAWPRSVVVPGDHYSLWTEGLEALGAEVRRAVEARWT